MAHDLVVVLRYERDREHPGSAQPIHHLRFRAVAVGLAMEGGGGQGVDGIGVALVLLPDDHAGANAQSYSMSRAVAIAALSPCRRRTTWRAISMPAETPAEVIISPSSTTRSSSSTVAAGTNPRRRSMVDQWLVARSPSSSPAAPSRNAP